MTHADKISACRDCQPEGFDDARDTMMAIILGETDPVGELCLVHREEMQEASRKWAEKQRGDEDG